MISIRRATPADAELLTALSYTSFRDAFADHPKNAPDDLAQYMNEAFTVDQIARELEDPNATFLVAEIDGVMVGYAKLIVDSIEVGITADRPIELSRLYSSQEQIGKGVGQTLMDACFASALGQNRDVMWLGVWEYNPRAQRFYEKNGFRAVGSHVFQLGEDPQTDILMQREI